MELLFSFLKFFSDTALWFGWGGMVLAFFAQVSNCLAAAVLIGIGAALGRTRLGKFGAAFSLLALTLCLTRADWLLVIPPVVNLLFCAWQDRLRPDATELYYRFSLRIGLGIAGALFSVILGSEWRFLSLMLGVTATVFLMRMLRHDPAEQGSRGLAALELALLAIFSLLCIFLSSRMLTGALWAAFRWLFSRYVMPVLEVALYLLVYAVGIIGWLISKLISDFNPDFPTMEAVGENMGLPMELVQAEPGQPNPIVVMLVRLAAALVFLAAALYLFRKMRGGLSAGAHREAGKEAERIAVEDAALDSPGILDRSPVARIRRSYAAYCRAVQRSAGRLSPADTTRSVNVLAGLPEDPDALRLRALYCRARYGEDSTLTRGDAAEAAALSRDLRGRIHADNM